MMQTRTLPFTFGQFIIGLIITAIILEFVGIFYFLLINNQDNMYPMIAAFIITTGWFIVALYIEEKIKIPFRFRDEQPKTEKVE